MIFAGDCDDLRLLGARAKFGNMHNSNSRIWTKPLFHTHWCSASPLLSRMMQTPLPKHMLVRYVISLNMIWSWEPPSLVFLVCNQLVEQLHNAGRCLSVVETRVELHSSFGFSHAPVLHQHAGGRILERDIAQQLRGIGTPHNVNIGKVDVDAGAQCSTTCCPESRKTEQRRLSRNGM